MKFLDLKEALKGYTLFSVQEIKKIDHTFHRRRLSEWQEKGYLQKIIRGYYMFSDVELNESVLFEIANRIHQPSYISLEIALSYYHLIPESVYGITSITTRKPYQYSTSLGEFSYRYVKPSLFFGYELVNYQPNKIFKIGYPEKVLIDFFYLNPHIKSSDDFESLRINSTQFWEHINEDRMYQFVERIAQKRLTHTVRTFMECMKHA
jgi:predicted transcriptional regulator of viral defense system